MDVSQMYLGLACAPFLMPSTTRHWLEQVPDVTYLWRADIQELQSLIPRYSYKLEKWCLWRRSIEIEKIEEKLQKQNIGFICKVSRDYPMRLLNLSSPPIWLFYQGNKKLLNQKNVGVVGTRRASPYGLEACRWISGVLSFAHITVVSGMALGIDGEAHQAALQGPGKTIAVLASGLNISYPVTHSSLQKKISEEGLCVSEYAPNVRVKKYQFIERNRILAALSESLIVVQAGHHSGALTTAELALNLGREVYAVPGPITSVHCQGSNQLLYDGAKPLIHPEEFLLEMGIEKNKSSLHSLPENWKILLQQLEEPLGIDELMRILRWPKESIYAILLETELSGWVERLPGGRFIRKNIQ
ncbi:DNA processing protein [Alicyclobacillus tengchongensis]|uniref:DNA processing protein n=2 Tax=Alicyclobacillus tolerans TaxID=90970 RepID=A0ABT9LZT8_9BACL|nr:DNA processing protein [Alicyclobacillus tengchongensis]SHK35349.1 DNA protecting protein DprA [Alicyclobacillus montanus]